MKDATIVAIQTGNGLFTLTLECRLSDMRGTWDDAFGLNVEIKGKEVETRR